jgi:hypothetical protein
VGSCGFAEDDTDSLGSGIDNSLNVGAAEGRAIVVTADLREDEIGDLINEAFIIAVLVHNRKAMLSPFVFVFDGVDLRNAALVAFLRYLARNESPDDLLYLVKRVLAAAKRQNVGSIMLA